MKLFVCGTAGFGNSAQVTSLSEPVKEYLDRAIRKNVDIIVGDCKGIDTEVQTYLNDKNYKNVTIYCSGNNTRNNIGKWPVKNIPAQGLSGRDFFAAKDKAMQKDCDLVLAIWDNKSKGTRENINSVLNQHKRVDVYDLTINQFRFNLGKQYMTPLDGTMPFNKDDDYTAPST